MTWFKIDDGFWSHPKTLKASKKAIGLWAVAGSWCGHQLTDGSVPSSALAMFGATARDAGELVACGLWEAVPGGYQFHDWADYQPPREKVLAERKAAKDRQQKSRSSRRHGVTEVVTDAVTYTVSHATPTRPDPTRSFPNPPPSEGGAPSPWCSNHPGGTSEPCGACGDARLVSKMWRKQEEARPTSRPPRAEEADDCGHGLPTWDRRSCRDCVEHDAALQGADGRAA